MPRVFSQMKILSALTRLSMDKQTRRLLTEVRMMVIQCPYNEFITCGPTNMDCSKCGWKPEVHEERLKKLRNEDDQEDN